MRQLNIKNDRPSGGNLKPCLYIGKPFSYYGNCEKLNRKSIANDRCFSLYECITPQDAGVSYVSTYDDKRETQAEEESLQNAPETSDVKFNGERNEDLAIDDVDIDVDIVDEEWETSGWERARGFGRG
jgi:hypothetical protein